MRAIVPFFVSKAYKASIWTSHEMRSAQARAVKEKGSDYILPIKVDDTELDGLPGTIAHIDIGKGIICLESYEDTGRGFFGG